MTMQQKTDSDQTVCP